MRILIIHHEAEYFAGAEKMLGYFLEGLASLPDHHVTVATVRESRVRELIPSKLTAWWIPPNSKFSPFALLKQLAILRKACRTDPVDVVHAWAARDWELAALTGKVTWRPVVGTLHDHPRAPFISASRQRLMHWSAAGLNKVVCVSEAVRHACLEAGYNERKLAVVHNGLPPSPQPTPVPQKDSRVFRLGYLGLFSERKGLRTLFEALDELARLTPAPWKFAMAGDAQEDEGRRLVARLKETFASKPWWPRIEWCGWVKHPAQFLASIDLLICPSSDFDPFPTVVLEAAQAGVPVLGARVGGIPEMIEEGKTGWLFDRHNSQEAARRLQEVLECPDRAGSAGREAKKRVEGEFTIHRMVQNYLNVYAGSPVI